MSFKRGTWAVSGLLMWAVMLVSATGCPKLRIPSQKAAVGFEDDVVLPSDLLRVQVYEFGGRCAATIMETADEISKQSTDPEVGRNALWWKIHATPAVQAAIFDHYDPLASMIDIWSFTIQMSDFFEDGLGRDLFGPLQYMAVEASQQLERQVLGLIDDAVRVDADISEAQQRIVDWSRQHPLDNYLFLRDSTSQLLVAVTKDKNRTALEALGRLDQALALLSDRISSSMHLVPNQARWQAEWMFAEIMEDPRIARTFDTTEQLADMLDRTHALIEDVPRLAESSVEEVLTTLQSERAAVLDSVDAQRVDTLEALMNERVAVLEAIELLRQKTLVDLTRERVETTSEIEAVGAAMIDRSAERAEALLDRLLIWLTVLLVGAAVMILVSVLLLARALRARTA